MERERLPGIATGDAPVVRAVPLSHMLSLMSSTLLLASGPSSVAVTFGASRTSITIEVVDGRKWNWDGVIPVTCVSCQPENPRVAEMLVFVSRASSSKSKLHEPSMFRKLLRLVGPFTEEVNVNQTEGGVGSLAPTFSNQVI